MESWIALAAVIGSTIVGLAGIIAAIYGSKRQTEATLAQIAAERERQGAEYAEDHRRNRQTTYHLFLTAAAQVRAMGDDVASGTEEAEKARWEFLHLLHGVELFGTEDVRQAAMEVTAALETASRTGRVQIFEQPPGYVTPEGRASLEAFFQLVRRQDVADRMDDLLKAMRADVAPERMGTNARLVPKPPDIDPHRR